MFPSRSVGVNGEKCPAGSREKPSRHHGPYSKTSVRLPSITCCMSSSLETCGSSFSGEEDEFEDDEHFCEISSETSNIGINLPTNNSPPPDPAAFCTSTVVPLQSSPPSSPSADIQVLVANHSNTAVNRMDSILDIERIGRTLQMLQSCGWYYEGLTWQQATKLLQGSPLGTFIIRDSSDPRYLFSLSVQTERGPTSVRIHYVNCQFRLDSEDSILNSMPLFRCVVQLIEYYVKLSSTEKSRAHVWLDNSGRRDLHIRLTRPLRRHVPSLQHLCRTSIHKALPDCNVSKLQIPPALKTYLKDYPYEV